VFTAGDSLIELLRNALQVVRLGAKVITGLVGPVLFPKQLTAGTLTWVSETPGSDVSDSDLTTGSASLSPKTAQASTSFSRQLLQQASLSVEQLVRDDLVRISAEGIDKAAIQGTGTLQPLGVLATAGIGVVEIGTDGGYPTLGHLFDLEAKTFIANVRGESYGLLTTPGVRSYLRKTLKIPGSTFAIFIWDESRPDECVGYRALVSNNVPSTLVKGTKSDCHAIIFGDWSELTIGEWGVIDLIVDPYRLKKQGIIEVTSFCMVDVAIRHPEAFAVIKDARIVA
jgi:HK97 family phage major capsid protein